MRKFEVGYRGIRRVVEADAIQQTLENERVTLLKDGQIVCILISEGLITEIHEPDKDDLCNHCGKPRSEHKNELCPKDGEKSAV